MVIRAVIFDMYETLITLFDSPTYFGRQMAEDIGIDEKKFREIWDASEDARTLGHVTLEDVVMQVLQKNDCYSDVLFQQLVTKRCKSKEDCFNHLHPQILPMLQTLKENGFQIGLISNCFSEEAKVIHESILYPYFNAPLLSCECGIKKPDPRIFHLCMDKLNVQVSECLYIGDGGSMELETAKSLGMHTAQAVWYLKEGTTQPAKRKPEFDPIEKPMDVMSYLVHVI